MNKPNLLLLHGALGSKETFSKIESVLSDYFNCHTFNFTGHGDQIVNETGEFSIQLFTDNILDYLNKNKIDQTNIFGYSMGGYAGMYFSYLYPEKINKIFTLATKYNWNRENAERETGFLNLNKMQEKVPFFVEELKKNHITDLNVLLDKTKNMMFELAADNILNENTIPEIKCTVRLGVGDKDNTAGVEDTLKIFRLLSDAQLEVFPGTPHPFEKVNHKKLIASIIDFFL